MARAFWIFCNRASDGKPDLPAGHGGSTTTAGLVYRLTGSVQPHTHTLAGGISMPSHNILGDQYDVHTHTLIKHNGDYAQVTVPAAVPQHTHDYSVDANGNIVPDSMLVFWYGPTSSAAAVIAYSGVLFVAEATVTLNEDGANEITSVDETPWSGAQRTAWENLIMSRMGFELPAQITNGYLLAKLFVGGLLAKVDSDESKYRFTRMNVVD